MAFALPWLGAGLVALGWADLALNARSSLEADQQKRKTIPKAAPPTTAGPQSPTVLQIAISTSALLLSLGLLKRKPSKPAPGPASEDYDRQEQGFVLRRHTLKSASLTEQAVEELLALLEQRGRTVEEEERVAALAVLLSNRCEASSPASPRRPSRSPSRSPSMKSIRLSETVAEADWVLSWSSAPLFWTRERDLPGASVSQAFDTSAGTVAATVTAGPLRLAAAGKLVRESSLDHVNEDDEVCPAWSTDFTTADAHLGAIKLPLLPPWVRLKGETYSLRYSDERVRVFRTQDGGLAVQVRRVSPEP